MRFRRSASASLRAITRTLTVSRDTAVGTCHALGQQSSLQSPAERAVALYQRDPGTGIPVQGEDAANPPVPPLRHVTTAPRCSSTSRRADSHPAGEPLHRLEGARPGEPSGRAASGPDDRDRRAWTGCRPLGRVLLAHPRRHHLASA